MGTTRSLGVDAMPVNIVPASPAGLGLTTGQTYRLQNTGSSFVYVAEATTSPTANSNALILRSHESIPVKPDGTNVWVWTHTGGSAVTAVEA